jgi:DNA-binding XRE family transcriptional regulator
MKTLKKIREKLGFTHYKAAKRVGLTQQGYIVAEKSSRSIKVDVLVALKELSGLTWEEVGKMLESDAQAIRRERKSIEKQGE